MKKAVDVMSVILGIIGVLIIFGSAGNSDCLTEYPLILTIEHTLFGMMLCVPVIVRYLKDE